MSEIVEFVSSELRQLADPVAAGPMQAYMKTTMPFYGVKRPQRRPIEKALKARFAPADHAEYLANVAALWALPHREEKYLALAYARGFNKHITLASLGLYERLIREGAWWDFVDEVAARLVGRVYKGWASEVRPVLDRWIEDEDFWIRRSAIICQLDLAERTDAAQLFDYCLRRAHEKEFFIRKAIGWALRQYAKTAPEAVAGFLTEHRADLSGLSWREGAKHLIEAGLLER